MKLKKPAKPPAAGPASLGATREDNPELIRALADIRNDLVRITEGNIRANDEENAQTISVQALIASKTAELQAKIDDYEGQIHNLKGELRTQKKLIQQMTSETADARDKLGTSSRNVTAFTITFFDS